jgi:hypothetical protein
MRNPHNAPAPESANSEGEGKRDTGGGSRRDRGFLATTAASLALVVFAAVAYHTAFNTTPEHAVDHQDDKRVVFKSDIDPDRKPEILAPPQRAKEPGMPTESPTPVESPRPSGGTVIKKGDGWLDVLERMGVPADKRGEVLDNIKGLEIIENASYYAPGDERPRILEPGQLDPRIEEIILGEMNGDPASEYSDVEMRQSGEDVSFNKGSLEPDSPVLGDIERDMIRGVGGKDGVYVEKLPEYYEEHGGKPDQPNPTPTPTETPGDPFYDKMQRFGEESNKISEPMLEKRPEDMFNVEPPQPSEKEKVEEIEIKKGDGWYDVFARMGVLPEDRKKLLKKLEKDEQFQAASYYAKGDGRLRIGSAPGQLDPKLVEIIRAGQRHLYRHWKQG